MLTLMLVPFTIYFFKLHLNRKDWDKQFSSKCFRPRGFKNLSENNVNTFSAFMFPKHFRQKHRLINNAKLLT